MEGGLLHTTEVVKRGRRTEELVVWEEKGSMHSGSGLTSMDGCD